MVYDFRMEYCPPNSTFGEIWLNHGTSVCFMDTVAPSVVAAYLLIFAAIEIRMYKKYGTPVGESLPKPFLYKLQVFLTFMLPCLAALRFILQAAVFNHGVVYGYMIVSLGCILTVYPLSYWLIYLERNYLLPSVPPQGHGVILLIFWALQLIAECSAFFNLHQESWWFNLSSFADKVELGIFIVRFASCVFIFILGMKAPGIMPVEHFSSPMDNGPLLAGPSRQETSVNQGSTFRNFFSKMRTLVPYMWPKRDLKLQCYVLICIALLLGGRVINLYVPLYSKLIVDSMTGSDLKFRWDLLLLYVFFKFLQGGGTGGMGLLNNLRSFLWIGVQQYTTREIELELFSHLHGLSLQWHLSRKTGEVLRIMDRGTDSIFNLFNYMLFSIAPTVVDILVAIIYFVSAFNAWFGIIVFLTMGLYMVITMLVTEWRTKFQRSMNLADNAQKARSVDSLLNFETVKYYGAESYEIDCFREAILKFQTEEWKSNITLNILNSLQNFIVCGGLLGGSMLCVHMVVNHEGLTVGDYVLFASYIIQLYVPLNWFGTYYRLIQKNFVDMENMLELLKEKQEVHDIPGAKALEVKGATVEFRNVSFSYLPEKPVLKNVSFIVPAGHTVALVGPSGSGKSTIIRLLFRFYDINEGTIIIDDQDISQVTQESLRSAIGVVPQDTVLFNNTIRFNIRYGRINAFDHEIISAAQYADIHDKILNFPDGYETQVGERGLKLSGGEKQRVAIARTLLKAPSIVLLDEATSALDTETERNIQDALSRVCAHRTTVVVAHRLSTIINCDEILVLKDGEIVERGTHSSLLNLGGVYNRMWNQQIENEEEYNESEKGNLLPEKP
ncbi:hypothetical protein R5R35_003828 [Gryllus longicercus]|uniref:ATP-binding cassette sub-family B member 6 n=2 Tax=Gryllus longicercus TaxID=2509291 RepID=A0AAN9VNS2_9ORTH